jgi:hypothetical protein
MGKNDELASFADRLKAKLFAPRQEVSSDSEVMDLVDAHLDMVSAAHASAHLSGHTSHGSGHLSAF